MSGIVLDLCGGTGSWSAPYREHGYDVRLVTLPDHDVLTYEPPPNVHGILAAPPCCHFATSGRRWWRQKDADGRTATAVAVVRACLRIVAQARPAWWALENPSGRLWRFVPELMYPRLSFDPCDYGDPYTKRTHLWGWFCIPPKSRVEPVVYEDSKGRRGSWLWANVGGGAKGKAIRSVTPPGFSAAFFKANP